jgi:hypothetical protein
MFLYLCVVHRSVKCRMYVHVCLWLHEYICFIVFVCYIYAYMCLCVHVYLCTFLHGLLFVCGFTHLYISVHIHLCALVPKCVFMCVCVCICVYSRSMMAAGKSAMLWLKQTSRSA